MAAPLRSELNGGDCFAAREQPGIFADELRAAVNRIYPDEVLLKEATDFTRQLAKGPTRGHGAHKALLRAWAVGGVAAADEAMFDIAMLLFETEDVKLALPLAVNAQKAGKPRPVADFKGR
jgi:hypothetical protein